MFNKLLHSIAFSLLVARWKQTLVAGVGVTFGITMFITLLSFMNGLNDMLDGLIINRTPHVKIYNEIKPSATQPIQMDTTLSGNLHFIRSIKATNSREELYNSSGIKSYLASDARVLGYEGKVSSQVFFNDGNIDIAGFINGIDVAEERRLFHFDDYVVKGDPMDIELISNTIILGRPLAEKLLADIGDNILVTTPQGNQFSLKVVGYYESGYADYDKSQSYASNTTVQKILGKPKSYYTQIDVKLNDLEKAPAVAKEYQNIFDTQAEDIQTANAQFDTGTQIRNLISYVVGITLLIVAGFGIYNILNMLIYEKMDTIAILKATGFSGKDVMFIFLFISLSIGLAGGVAGLIFGYLLSLLIDTLPFETSALPTISTYPIDYDMSYYIIAIIFALLTTFFSGVSPARKASRVDPVDIIRGK